MKSNLLLKTVLAAAFSIAGIASMAQAPKTPAKSLHEKVYFQAKALADFPTAIQSVHYLVAETGEATSRWNDSLALLYFQSGAYIQSYTLAEKMLQQGPATDLRLEMKAASARRLDQPLAAIDGYSQLFSRTNNAYYGFEQLQLEYGIRRLAEAVVTATKVLKAAGTADSTRVSVPRRDGKQVQEVSLVAAARFTQALAFYDLHQETNAADALKEALAAAPAYELALDLQQKLNTAAKN
ncbi:hypothetical protein SAMN05444008_107262 [Cnuella takakiae]|uniref:Tetratricopeptide repeat-containing protein n=1 Tax=Cnuella takakiae TaxID=1302690 RepID=A0A1M5BD56_9BACT|nr:hypothetical protein [Cnuella takakiae]OLY93438.1 hypothetical protein BUE76_17265 [Cnuella takakiae]SHF40454.1 hypothetical protein SAMN05444008_107262 [Cnuella takakiae]